MRVIAATVFAIGTLTGTVAAQESAGYDDRAAALRSFHERVESYAALHRRLEEPLPPMTVTTDTWATFLAKRYLAAAIRAARPSARQGDIFSPAIAIVFRQLISEALVAHDVEALLIELNEEQPVARGVHPLVNEPYPKGVTHEVPAILLQRLPALPEDVEYRIVDRDLLLWDIHADLVIDFVPDAFGPPPTTEE